jgi:hypothetical protein
MSRASPLSRPQSFRLLRRLVTTYPLMDLETLTRTARGKPRLHPGLTSRSWDEDLRRNGNLVQAQGQVVEFQGDLGGEQRH